MSSQPKRALITGIAGQDGAYLARLLLDQGYEVHGVHLWDSVLDQAGALERLGFLNIVPGDLSLHSGDLIDSHYVSNLISQIEPDEIYHLAAPSHVQESFKTPAKVLESVTKSALNIFEGVKLLGLTDRTKIYLASSSEMFGNADHSPQNEETPFNPCSPYGIAKTAAHHLARTYREAYGLQICCGILFNHESPLRGCDFVTRKISHGVAAIAAGQLECLCLGNLEAKRDWGHAADYVSGMWKMLQQKSCRDYVLATGDMHNVRDFVSAAFACAGYQIEWRGNGLEEVAIDAKSQQILVRVDECFYRPLELHALRGDASKARQDLGWSPKISFNELVADMVRTDLQRFGLDMQGAPWKKVG